MTTQTDGAIGYVEYAYAKQNKMSFALADQQGGRKRSHRTPSPSRRPPPMPIGPPRTRYYLILTDQAGAKSWPITGASFILVYKEPPDPAAVHEALKFFDWAYKDGAAMAAELDYVPLPAPLIAQVAKTWATSITSGGHPVWSGMKRRAGCAIFQSR